MSCSKGKKSKKEKNGRYQCEKCGVVRDKKKELCRPRKIEKGER